MVPLADTASSFIGIAKEQSGVSRSRGRGTGRVLALDAVRAVLSLWEPGSPACRDRSAAPVARKGGGSSGWSVRTVPRCRSACGGSRPRCSRRSPGGGEAVAALTIARLDRLGWRWSALPPLRDGDQPEDLVLIPETL
jgi:hypothetical protein